MTGIARRKSASIQSRLPAVKARQLAVAIATIALMALSLFVVFRLAPEAGYRKDLGFTLQQSGGSGGTGGTLSIDTVTGPAAAGVQPGDVVVSWNGLSITPQTRPASLVYRLAPDQPYTLTLKRGRAIV